MKGTKRRLPCLNTVLYLTGKMPSTRIRQEQEIVEQMVRLYCRQKEGHTELCPDCKELLQYAHARLSRCPFGEKKTTCRLCPVHCYKPDMRKKMQEVIDSVS